MSKPCGKLHGNYQIARIVGEVHVGLTDACVAAQADQPDGKAGRNPVECHWLTQAPQKAQVKLTTYTLDPGGLVRMDRMGCPGMAAWRRIAAPLEGLEPPRTGG